MANAKKSEKYSAQLKNSGEKFDSIQKAVDAASDGDTVFVLPGLHKERIVINKKITLSGMSDSSELPVVSYKAKGCDCVIEISADATLKNINVCGRAGSGVCVVNGAKAKILNIKSSRNKFGVTANNGAFALVKNSELYENTSAGINAINRDGNVCGGTIQVKDCDIHNNGHLGIGAAGIGSKVVASGTKLYGNESGAGILEGASAVLTDCKIYNNSRIGLGVWRVNEDKITTKLKLKNCDVYSNEADGVYVYGLGREIIIEETEIHHNKASGVGVRDGGRAVLKNCKIHENDEEELWIFGQDCETVIKNTNFSIY